jgi:TRAP-type C4-dicarboxylate transport system permease small subunit
MKHLNVSDAQPKKVVQDALPSSKKLGRSSTALACLGGTMLIAMMLLTVCDVIGRYMFNAPILGAAELTEVLLCATIFMGLGAVCISEDHVTVDLLTDQFPDALQPYRLAFTGLFGGVLLAVVSWRLWVYAAQIGSYGGTTTSLSIPIAPLGYFCAICTAIGALITTTIPFMRLAAQRKT